MKLEVGMKIGRLTLKRKQQLQTGSKGNFYTVWFCCCDCGTKEYRVWSSNLLRPVATMSCGCYQRECISKRSRTHGERGYKNKKVTPEYQTWCSIIYRCTNIKSKSYPDYGGRGIKVCPRWRHSYKCFLEDVGRRPNKGHTLERTNNDKGYQPDNVRWATRREQARNTRRNRWLTIDGVCRLLKDWGDITGISPTTISQRLKLGWTEKESVTTPVRKQTSVLISDRR